MFSPLSAKFGRTSLARSAKRRIASIVRQTGRCQRRGQHDLEGTARGGTGKIISPAIPSGARLVISTVSRGQAATSAAIDGAAPRTCSRLSRTRRVSRSCRYAMSASSVDWSTDSRTPKTRAIAGGTRSGSLSGGERHEPDAVRVALDHRGGDGEAEAGLADTAGTESASGCGRMDRRAGPERAAPLADRPTKVVGCCGRLSRCCARPRSRAGSVGRPGA